MITVNETREEDRFPILTDEWIRQIRDAGAQEEAVPAGTVLLEEGDMVSAFFVVLEGALDIIDGKGTSIVRERRGQFTGDTTALSGRVAVARYVAAEDSRVLRLPIDVLQRLVVERSELSDVILRAFLARRVALVKGGLSSTRVIGSRFSSDTHRILEFLTRNSHPFVWLDIETDPSVADVLEHFGVTVDETPVVICRGNNVHRNPSNEDLARHIGLEVQVGEKVVDVVVVGAGPAGLAATVYAASEGLEVVTVDTSGPGGQAGTSSKIENYLGFPMGISGQELADRALLQAQKFGARVSVGHAVQSLACEEPVYAVAMAGGQVIRARALVVASGAQYRRLPVEGHERFEGRGVYYGATSMEGTLCRGCAVVVVGGGNSAGQATVFLSGIASEVHHVVRREGLGDTMSRYLIRRIEETPNVHLHVHTEVAALEGTTHLERLRLRNNNSGAETEVVTPGLFVMIGAVPCTEWLCDGVALDSHGFVLTGRDLLPEHLKAANWPLARAPFPYETSKPRIFAVGDVRSDSTKRVATAVGEGSGAVQYLHRALADLA